jgi:hypothetical protein
MDISETSDIPGKFGNVVLKNDGVGRLDRSCEKRRSVTLGQGGGEYRTWNKNRNAKWIGQILGRNCLLKHGTEGKIEGRSDGKTSKNT